jgi:hypothetical protein
VPGAGECLRVACQRSGNAIPDKPYGLFCEVSDTPCGRRLRFRYLDHEDYYTLFRSEVNINIIKNA